MPRPRSKEIRENPRQSVVHHRSLGWDQPNVTSKFSQTPHQNSAKRHIKIPPNATSKLRQTSHQNRLKHWYSDKNAYLCNRVIIHYLKHPTHMTTTTQINSKRLDYLLALFGMSKEDLLSSLNKDRKRPFSIEDIYGDEIKISLLKQIDKIFHKGIPFYLDFSPIDTSQKTKVFFRKSRFQSILTMEDKRIVDSYESLKVLLDSYRTLTDTLSTDYKFYKS